MFPQVNLHDSDFEDSLTGDRWYPIQPSKPAQRQDNDDNVEIV